VLQQWGLSIRKALLSRIPCIPHSQPLSELHNGIKLQAEQIDRLHAFLAETKSDKKAQESEKAKEAEASKEPEDFEATGKVKNESTTQTSEAERIIDLEAHKLEEAEAKKIKEAAEFIERRDFLMVSIEMIVLDCCKKMRVLELSQNEEFSNVSDPIENTSENLLRRLDRYTSDVQQFTCYIETEEMLDNLQVGSIGDYLAAFMKTHGMEDVD
jgi:hypothetical protein